MNGAFFNLSLAIGGALSLIASLLHIAIIFKGAEWYRFFGAGERYACASERGEIWPSIVTFGIATILFTWAMYAFSGGGLIRPLPWLKPILLMITSIYILRGIAIVPLYFLARKRATTFMIWSSLICIGYGLVHAIGIMQEWGSIR